MSEAADKAWRAYVAEDHPVSQLAPRHEGFNAGFAAAQVVPQPKDKAEFEAAVAAERQRQIEKGYTPEHDDEKGAKHLINWVCDYIVKGEPVKAMALLVATLQHLERLSPAPLTIDRDALIRAVKGVLFNVSNYPHKAQPYLLGTDNSPLTAKVTDAVIAHLSTQGDDLPERDATPDEAFELGRVAGYDEAMREVAAQTVEGEVECSHTYSRIKFDGGSRAVVCNSCDRIISHVEVQP